MSVLAIISPHKKLQKVRTMYIGDPQSVAAIMLFWRYLAKPKSAVEKESEGGKEGGEQETPEEDELTFGEMNAAGSSFSWGQSQTHELRET